MEPFDEETHWNLLQVLAWVYLGDRKAVRDASSATDEHGSFFQEIPLVFGGTTIVETYSERPGPLRLGPVAVWNGGAALPSYVDAERAVMAALIDGRLHCLGLANGTGDLIRIASQHWAGLDFYFDKDKLPYAAPPQPDHNRPDATHWQGLMFRREDVFALWPDPFDNTDPQPPDKTLNSGLTLEAQKRGGEASPASGQHLQSLINFIRVDIDDDITDARFVHWFREKEITPKNPYTFSEDFRRAHTDDKGIVWSEKNGKREFRAFSTLRRYFNAANGKR